MVTLTARCPYCHQTLRTMLQPGTPVICEHCQATLQTECPTWAATDAANGPAAADPPADIRCLTCPSTELFVRKDFPQRLGVGIVVAGFVASSITWYAHQVIATYAILFATALVDVILYVVMGNVLECYRCHAQYRGLSTLTGEKEFNLEINERYRQQAARLAAHAPAAEHPASNASASSTVAKGSAR